MKKLNIILYVFFLLVLSSLASAYSTDRTDYYYNGTHYLTDNLEAADLGLDGVAVSAEENMTSHGWSTPNYCDATSCSYNSTQAQVGTYSMMFNPLNNARNNGLQNIKIKEANASFTGTIGFRFYEINPTVTNNFYLDIGGDADWPILRSDGDNWHYREGATTAECDLNVIPYSAGWHNITINFSSDSATTVSYVDGVACHNSSDIFGLSYIILSLNKEGVTGQEVYIDDFWIADGGRPEGVPSLATATPTIVPPSPADNAHNNTNVTLNVTHGTAANDVRYYLYFGDTSTLTEDYYYLFNVTRTGDEYKSFTTNVSDGTYYWKWRVQNITSGVFSANTTQRTWTLDTVNPTITRLTNNNWETDNSTIISSYLSNLTINTSVFDINLHQTLINITNESNNNVTTFLNTSITGTTVNVSKTIDISNWALGNYTIKLIATDSHTAKEIENYNVVKGLNYLRYKTKEGNIIKIISDTIPLTFNTNKFKDRYDFEFNYLLSKEKYKFRIESYNKIDYIEDSDYPAHFVIMAGNGRGNWLDFGGIDKKDIAVTKINDYNYEIEITSNGKTSFEFNSLGGLNTVEDHYKIQLAAVLDIQVGNDETGDWINATINISSQIINTIVYNQSNVTPARVINITKETTSLILTATGYGTETKTFSVTEKYHNLSFNMTEVSATKLYFYDEKSEALITGETFSVYLETTGFSSTYSAATNPYTISSLQSGLYKLKASSGNYPERQYLDLNISNVTTTNLNIYLINNTLGSEITFNIVSVDGLVPLEDVRTVFTKIINGTSTVIVEEESDFAGQVVVTLDSNTQYTINFSKTDYEDRTITLEPKNLEYLIKMVSTIGAYNQSVHEGIRYKFEPSNIILNNNTKYNFTFTLNSTVWDVTGCALYLRNGSTLLDSTSSYTSSSCFLRIEQDTFSMTNITSEVIYQIGSAYNFTVSQQYSIIYTYEGQFSLKNFLDDLTDFSMAGFDSFGRRILAFIVIFIILAMASMKISFEHKEVPLFIFWALVGFFSYVNWFYLDLGTMPDLLGLKKWFVFYLVSLVCAGFMMNKFRR